MVIDGKAMAKGILNEVAARVAARPSGAPQLVAITAAPNFETRKYLAIKKRQAAAVGIELIVRELPDTVTTADVISCVQEVEETADGIVVQLPLPVHVDRDAVLVAVPVAKDPDGFQYGGLEEACLPPVVGAIDEISKRHGVVWEGKRVVVLGNGRLVGKPAAVYAKARGARVMQPGEADSVAALAEADIVVSGIGRPHFVRPAMLKDGVVVFDAGTSEDGGVLAGDVAAEVGSKAALLTPVPGGIGPLTIACLLRNVLKLARQ